ncbi:hypothetical protein N867_12910, partial [Actinotalea fermentans ATCC 43279 = JCM 9966 = DSM 3133]
PPLRRSGPVDAATRAQAVAALGVPDDAVLDAAWVDNGPEWLGLLLRDADTVLALRPDLAVMDGLKVGVVGLYDDARRAELGAHAEVRAFVPGIGIAEDPVTGSLNAGLALWLIPAGVLPERYVVSQGTVLRRAGRVHVERAGDATWIGGDAVTCVAGTVTL